jgi:hypothetical protein
MFIRWVKTVIAIVFMLTWLVPFILFKALHDWFLELRKIIWEIWE